ncbi:MAG: GLPGLI family protein [Bacteroidales bacterium]|nr:GLPGLI family protein [Bacteroidales bacterium]
MKKIIILALAVVSCTFAIAQTRGYKCTYQQKFSLQFDKHKDMDGEMAEMITKALGEMKTYYILTFADGKSLFELDKKNSDNPMGDFSNTVYTDMTSGIKVMQDNTMGKMFLVTDSLDEFDWTITDQTKEINGRMCTKAVLGGSQKRLEDMQGELEDLENIDFAEIIKGSTTAWFSPETPIPAGPMGFMGLPGLIVELDMQAMKYTLTDIQVVEDMPEVTPPTKGKKVTGKEFREIQKKKMQEMRFGGFRGDDDGPRGGFQIMIGR